MWNQEPAHIVKMMLLVMGGMVAMGLLGVSVGIWWIDYTTFVDTVLAFLNRQNWKDYFETKVFPASRYEFVRYFVPVLLFIWLLVFYVFSKRLDQYSQSIANFISTTRAKISAQFQQFQAIEKKYFIAIILLFMLRGAWQIYHYELQYDEAWTYNHFVSKGLLISAISPNNNHILYTLLACITDYCPVEGKYSLRLPVYFGGIATCLLMYWMLRDFWGWKWAIVALSWFAFSSSICFYSMYARGYIFQILFTILAVWASLKITKNTTSSTSYYWGIWSIANVLAAYSVPTHAYTWIILNVFLLIIILKQKKLLKEWLQANIIVVIAIIFLYFPFLITNGISTLWNAASADAPNGEAFISYQDKVADWLWVGGGRGTSVYWFQLLLISALALLYYWNKEKDLQKHSILLVILFLAFPSFLNLTIGTQPPYRVWCFLAVFIAMAIGVIFSTGVRYLSVGKSAAEYLTPVEESSKEVSDTSITRRLPQVSDTCAKLQKSLILSLAIIFISFNIWRTNQHYAIRWSEKIDQEAKDIAGVLMKKNIKETYLFSHYDKPLLEYYYLRQKRQLKTMMFDSTSLDYAPFVNAPMYECVIWDKEDRVATKEETNWLRAHYKDTIYENNRILVVLSF